AGEKEPDADHQHVDEHPHVGLRAERAAITSGEEVRAVQEESEERQQHDAARDDRWLDREHEKERDDDERDAPADRELLIEPQPAAELSLRRVVRARSSDGRAWT